MNTRALWLRIFIIIGSLAMRASALDPFVGALAILHGSGLVALGTLFGSSERRLFACRTVAFVLIAQSRPRLLPSMHWPLRQ